MLATLFRAPLLPKPLNSRPDLFLHTRLALDAVSVLRSSRCGVFGGRARGIHAPQVAHKLVENVHKSALVACLEGAGALGAQEVDGLDGLHAVVEDKEACDAEAGAAQPGVAVDCHLLVEGGYDVRHDLRGKRAGESYKLLGVFVGGKSVHISY